MKSEIRFVSLRSFQALALAGVVLTLAVPSAFASDDSPKVERACCNKKCVQTMKGMYRKGEKIVSGLISGLTSTLRNKKMKVDESTEDSSVGGIPQGPASHVLDVAANSLCYTPSTMPFSGVSPFFPTTPSPIFTALSGGRNIVPNTMARTVAQPDQYSVDELVNVIIQNNQDLTTGISQEEQLQDRQNYIVNAFAQEQPTGVPVMRSRSKDR